MSEPLRIVFICGCIEPGRDGVGDYTRRLSAELILTGHFTAIIAINDVHTTEIIDDHQVQGGIRIPTLRLPSLSTYKSRFGKAKMWLNSFDPNWISLQFVPFSFHAKGLPFALARDLSLLGEGRKWHIMFHELWVGMDKESPLKMRAWGYVSKTTHSFVA